MFAQRLNAGYGTNGNRRVIYLEIDESGELVAVWGYYYDIPKSLRNHIPLPELTVTYSEYKDIVARAKNSGNWCEPD